MAVLREHYKISHGWKGKSYLGLDLHLDYDNHKVQLSILAYVTNALTILIKYHPRKKKHQPHLHINPTYIAKSHYAEDADMSPPLT